MLLLPESCFCCFDLKAGVLVAAVLIFIRDILRILLEISNSKIAETVQVTVLVGITFIPSPNMLFIEYVATLIEIILLILFFHGFWNETPGFVLPYIIWYPINLLIEVVSMLLTDYTLSATVSISLMLAVILNIYAWLCFFSYYVRTFAQSTSLINLAMFMSNLNG